jgi:predicted AAA+ superfamily ATPase
MALSNSERVGKALNEVRDGLLPYISRELYDKLGPGWQERLDPGASLQDLNVQLGLFMEHWGGVFKQLLSQEDRAYVSELKVARNKWAHSDPITSDDTDRYLDTAVRLCRSINAVPQAEAIRDLRSELQQVVFTERARNKVRYKTTTENQVKAGLVPWRDVITPHPDVITGRYQQAEFAADLDQVRQGKGSSEYTDPAEFFRRTYITGGLKDLLRIALRRLNGQDADPVIELQTNFGGGKTHSMLALYHLCSGTPLNLLAGLEEVCAEVGIKSIPKANTAVLVGTAFSAAEPTTKADGTMVNTLWGELAYQLGGPEGYAIVANSDRERVSPGARDLAELLRQCAPCLVLIDEWVAYARNLFGKADLPAGTYDSQISFAQALTEAAKQVPNALLLISVPQSTNEIGGSNGEKALEGLRNVLQRVATEWRPANPNEGFEIVRRRLFEPILTDQAGAHRDAVVRSFKEMYALNKNEFPAETREADYGDKLTASYPIHPELFQRLYDDWSTLPNFQRTRGVLRLLAKTIEDLWESGSKDVMIMPSSMPLDDNKVKNELLRYLPNEWEPIISTDVDGEGAIPVRIDATNSNLGRLSACKRVARSIYMGTAPGSGTAKPGIGDQRIKLACAMPGEAPAVFGDALRRLGDQARFLNQDGDRYWLDTKPNLNRTADEHKQSYLNDRASLLVELNQKLDREGKARGAFAGLHLAPPNSAAVPDEPATRLVVVPSQYPHKKGGDSAALTWAQEVLASRGSSPRQYANTLVFLAADERALDDLVDAFASQKAWQRISDNREELDLTLSQINLAAKRIKDATDAIDVRIPETWCHLLLPHQAQPGNQGPSWDEFRLTGGDPRLADRVSKKCKEEEALYVEIGASRIRRNIDNFLWPNRDSISVQELVTWCHKYPYLPRLSSDAVILNGLTNPQASLQGEATFHLADGFDEASGRYLGLKPQGQFQSAATMRMLIVKDEVAQAQIEAEQRAKPVDPPPGTGTASGSGTGPGLGTGTATGTDTGSTNTNTAEGTGRPGTGVNPPPPQAPPQRTTFTGSLKLDPVRAGLQMGQFLEEVMSHLQALPGAKVNLSVEVHVKAPNGIDDQTARIVLENAAALKLDNPQVY